MMVSIFLMLFCRRRRSESVVLGALEGYPFTVTDNFLVPEYKIDFGTYAIPEEEAAKDIYARIMYLNKPENQSCASVARFYQIDGYYIYFTFMWYDRVYLCRYSEKTKKSEIFAILTDEMQLKECSFSRF